MGNALNLTANDTETLQLDKPTAFTGSVDAGYHGEIDLLGLANADSYSYKNDILSIYSHNRVIDKLSLTIDRNPPFTAQNSLHVGKVGSEVVIDTYAKAGVALLAQHS